MNKFKIGDLVRHDVLPNILWTILAFPEPENKGVYRGMVIKSGPNEIFDVGSVRGLLETYISVVRKPQNHPLTDIFK